MISPGRWRPMQDSILLLFFFSNVWSLLVEDIDGTSVDKLYPGTIATCLRIAMIVGVLIALLGEVWQFTLPPVISSPKDIDQYVRGLYFEGLGLFLVVLGFVAIAIGITIDPLIPDARSLLYIILTSGAVFRIIQVFRGVSRVNSVYDNPVKSDRSAENE